MSQKPNTTPTGEPAKSSGKKFAALVMAFLLAGGGTWFAKKQGYLKAFTDRFLSGEQTASQTTPKEKSDSPESTVAVATKTHTLTPTGPAVPVGQSKPSSSPSAQLPAKDADGCFEVTYQHAKIASHNDGELCAEHKNKLTLDIKNLNPKSVCMRVNGNPIHAQVFAKKGQPTVVLFDSVAGPKSVVTARYCTGKVACGMDCKVSKDEFLDALGGADDSFMTGGVGAAAWDTTKKDGKATKTEVELEKELKDFRGEFAEKDEGQEKFFAGWQETARAEACEGRRVASVGAAKAHTRKQ